MHLQEIANQLSDVFTDTKRVTKSYIPAVNAPARIEIPKGQSENEVSNSVYAKFRTLFMPSFELCSFILNPNT